MEIYVTAQTIAYYFASVTMNIVGIYCNET